MRTLATLVFIAACAATAAYFAQRETVARGDVMEADLLAHFGDRGVARFDCDDRIPIRSTGAVFRCHVEGKDGSRGIVEYKMDRSGKIVGALVDGPRALPPTSGDPWGN